MKKHKITDWLCLGLTVALVFGVSLVILLQPDRPTVSEMEKRKLAEMPSFSLEALCDGTYFSGISAFVSDTFIARDKLVTVSKSLDSLRGLDYALDGDDNFVLIGKTGDGTETAERDDAPDAADQLAEAIESLKNREDEPAETEPMETESTETETLETGDGDPALLPLPESDAETAEAETEPITLTLRLSKQTLSLTVGSGAAVYAIVETNAESVDPVSWTVSDPAICSISANADGGVDVKALAAGTCTLTCWYGDTLTETCAVTVTEVVSDPPAVSSDTADFLTGGMFILGDAVYTQGYYVASNAALYVQDAAYYKQLFGDNVTVSTVVAPVSAMVVDNPDVVSKIPDQRTILDNMASLADPSVNFVNVYDEMDAHRDEHLFFKSDHHWTARGAYYAYRAFAESLGLTPTPLDGFDYAVLNTAYSGSMYQFTQDYRVKNFTDTVEAFYSRKAMTMTVTTSGGGVGVYDNCILGSCMTYSAFIAGDNPYTVINVPENPQDKNILVLKDSFGNAFVPFLCEHFGNIIVVDVRHFTGNVYEQLKDYGLSDIVFINNIQAANSNSWPYLYLSAVGYQMN